ncbi:hypothetical protein EPS65_05995 [Helcococcus ovis]|uniref:hypothetical protein n=2 Tax=Helcococcus ovis TaxID=72026 RepID=UPI0038BB5721
MKYDRKIYFFIFIVNISLLMGLNYLVSSVGQNNKYNLPINYLEFEKVKQTGFNLDKFKEMNNIIISETTNDNIIGIYDPNYKYYVNSTKIINPFVYRYFSNDDYMNNKDVAIYIGSIDDILRKSNFDFKSIGKRYNTEIINYFDFKSDIYEYPVILVKNLFSIKPEQITKIFISSDKENKINYELISKTLGDNFKLIERSDTKTIKDAISLIINGRLYEKIIASSLISVVLILIISITMYIKNDYFDVYVSKIFGANKMNYMLNFIKINIIKLVSTVFISSFTIVMYLKFINHMNLNMNIIIYENLVLLLLILIISLLNINHIFNSSSNYEVYL